MHIFINTKSGRERGKGIKSHLKTDVYNVVCASILSPTKSQQPTSHTLPKNRATHNLAHLNAKSTNRGKTSVTYIIYWYLVKNDSLRTLRQQHNSPSSKETLVPTLHPQPKLLASPKAHTSLFLHVNYHHVLKKTTMYLLLVRRWFEVQSGFSGSFADDVNDLLDVLLLTHQRRG